MYTTNRFWLKYGSEEDEMEVTTKEHATFIDAYKYANRYGKGRKFVSCIIEDETYNELFELHYEQGEHFYDEKYLEVVDQYWKVKEAESNLMSGV